MQVHDLTALSMEDAYSETQTNEEIKSGDVLIVKDGVAVLDRAWPAMVVGQSDVFHEIVNMDSFTARYPEAVEKACEIAVQRDIPN